MYRAFDTAQIGEEAEAQGQLAWRTIDLDTAAHAAGGFDCRIESCHADGHARATAHRFVKSGILFIDFALASVRVEARRRLTAFVPLDGQIGTTVSSGRQHVPAISGPMLLPPNLGLTINAGSGACAIALLDFDLDLLIERIGPLSEDGETALRRHLSRHEPRYLRSPAGIGGSDPFLTALLRALHGLRGRTDQPAYPELETCLLKAVHDGLQIAASTTRSTRSDRPGDARIRQICDLILGQLTSELKLDDLARETGLSARMIQYLFQGQFGISPKQWIIEQRLLAVRARLSQPSSRDTVTNIAIPFFNNLGDFARRYRQRFGEKPSQTLARARRNG